MPWLFDLHELLADTELMGRMDAKAVFCVLKAETLPRRGMVGPFLGPPNRRPIWAVCGQIREEYEEYKKETDEEDNVERSDNDS
jgi:hypothetical protein